MYAAAIERCEAGAEAPPAAAEAAGQPSVHAASADFITGFVGRNRRDRQPLGEMSFEEKLAVVYGGDHIVP